MEEFNNEIFSFGDEPENKEEARNFMYDSISGLGDSNYENEDLFVNEETIDNSNNSMDLATLLASTPNELQSTEPAAPVEQPVELVNEVEEVPAIGPGLPGYVEPVPAIGPGLPGYVEPVPAIGPGLPGYVEPIPAIGPGLPGFVQPINVFDNIEENNSNEFIFDKNGFVLEEPEKTDTVEPAPIMENQPLEQAPSDFVELDAPSYIEPTESEEVPVVENLVEEPVEEITLSDTPIEELQSLTEYKEDKIDTTDINKLFDRVSVNVQDASEIFKRNTDLKEKIDTRFEELKKLQKEVDVSKAQQLEEVNNYKDEVLTKLSSTKEEVEKRINILKESQATLEKEKKEFEQYKDTEQEKIDRVKKEVQAAYDDRREELNHIEDVLRKQRDALDEERNQLALDRIQYESDKNELANNLLKFNELVNSFTNGVNSVEE